MNPLNPPGPNAIHYRETALAVTLPKYVVAASIGASAIAWGISSDTGTSFLATGTLAPPPQAACPSFFGITYDPWLVASPTSGEAWLIGQRNAGSFPQGFAIAHKAFAALAFDSPTVSITCGGSHYDKPLLGFGANAAGADTMHLVFTTGNSLPTCSAGLYRMRPTSALPLGSVWDPVEETILPPAGGNPCPGDGRGAFPVVMPAGPFQGRLVVCFTPTYSPDPNAPGGFWEADSFNPAAVTWSDAGTSSWQSRVELNFLTQATTSRIYPISNDDVPGQFAIRAFPYATVDPAHPSNVYVAFSGTMESPGPAGTDRNLDLIIAKSDDGGTTFRFDQRLRITDAMLGEVAGTDQFMPAIAIDGFGGVNLLYYRTIVLETDGSQFLQAKYARIANYNGPSSSSPEVRILSVPFPPTVPASDPDGGIGDYQSMVAIGCLVFTHHMDTHEGSYNTYVTRISLCQGDVDSSAYVEPSSDTVAFGVALAASQPPADVDGNGVIDANDLVLFQQAITCGCELPPPQP